MKERTRLLFFLCAICVPFAMLGLGAFVADSISLPLGAVIMIASFFALIDLMALAFMGDFDYELTLTLMRGIKRRVRSGNHDISRMETCD